MTWSSPSWGRTRRGGPATPTEAGDIANLMSHFGLANGRDGLPAEHPARRTLRLIEEAIRRDLPFIARHPASLFQCLWNSCWWYDSPQAAQHYETADDSPVATHESHREEGSKLHRVLEDWRDKKEKLSPGFCWVRSLRPPAVRLGTALVACLRGHEGAVCSVAFSPDGARIASGSGDRTVRLWDFACGKELACLRGHEGAVCALAFSPDGVRIASGSDDGTVRLWDARSGELLVCLQTAVHEGPIPYHNADAPNLKRISLKGFQRGVDLVAFAPDGASIQSWHDGEIVIWDSQSGKPRECLKGENLSCFIGFSVDGDSFLADHSRGDDSYQVLVDRRGGLGFARLLGHKGWPTCAAITFDGRQVVSGAEDKTVRLWDFASGRELACLRGHEGVIRSVVLSPDGGRIASGSDDHSVRIWDPAHEQPVRLEGHEDAVSSVVFSPDGTLFVSASDDESGIRDYKPLLWKTNSGKSLARLYGPCMPVNSVVFSPDSKLVAAGTREQWDEFNGYTTHTLWLWKADDGMLFAAPSLRFETVNSMSFSPDGRRLVVGLGEGLGWVWYVHHRNEWKDGKFVHPPRETFLRGHEGAVRSVAFSLDGMRIVSGSDDLSVRLWDSDSGEQLACLQGHEGVVRCVALSPDGARIASASDDCTVRIWDASRAELLTCLQGHQGPIRKLAFSPDGVRIASESDDQTVRLWDVQKAELLELVQGKADIAAIARGASALRAVGKGQETVVEKDRRALAWFPVALRALSTHPNGRIWAGGSNNQVYLFALEGDPSNGL